MKASVTSRKKTTLGTKKKLPDAKKKTAVATKATSSKTAVVLKGTTKEDSPKRDAKSRKSESPPAVSAPARRTKTTAPQKRKATTSEARTSSRKTTTAVPVASGAKVAKGVAVKRKAVVSVAARKTQPKTRKSVEKAEAALKPRVLKTAAKGVRQSTVAAIPSVDVEKKPARKRPAGRRAAVSPGMIMPRVPRTAGRKKGTPIAAQSATAKRDSDSAALTGMPAGLGSSLARELSEDDTRGQEAESAFRRVSSARRPREFPVPPRYDIPDSYGGDNLLVIPVDPDNVFADWEIRRRHSGRLRGPLVLRVHDVTGMYGGTDARRSFDIPLAQFAGMAFFHLGMHGREAVLSVGMLGPDGRFRVLANSRRIAFPPRLSPEDLQTAGVTEEPERPVGY